MKIGGTTTRKLRKRKKIGNKIQKRKIGSFNDFLHMSRDRKKQVKKVDQMK